MTNHHDQESSHTQETIDMLREVITIFVLWFITAGLVTVVQSTPDDNYAVVVPALFGAMVFSVMLISRVFILPFMVIEIVIDWVTAAVAILIAVIQGLIMRALDRLLGRVNPELEQGPEQDDQSLSVHRNSG